MTKKLIVIAVFFGLLVMATVVNAAPFVVCDPYPAEASLTDSDPPNPDSFIIVFDNGSPQTVPAFVLPDGRVQLKADLGTVSKGKHIIRVKANHTVWGESAEVPFTFRAGTPKEATGVGLAK